MAVTNSSADRLAWLGKAITAVGLAAAAPALSQAKGTPGASPSLHEFGDWSVACDNSGRCEAVGVSTQRAGFAPGEWGEHGVIVLRIIREARPDAPLRVFLDERGWAAQPDDRHAALTLHVLYPQQDDRTGPAFRLLPLRNGQYEVDPRDVPAFLAESRNSTIVATRMGAINAMGSTQGMASAISYMGEARQPPAPLVAVPLIKASSGQQVGDEELRRRGLLLCGVVAAPHEGMRFRLGNGDTLWSVSCGEEHSASSAEFALNPHTIWFIERRDGTRAFPGFPRPDGNHDPLPATLPNSHFDPASGLLSAAHYYGQGRDCGWWRQWGWDGREWQPVAAFELRGCMGIMAEGWLPLWRAPVTAPDQAGSATGAYPLYR